MSTQHCTKAGSELNSDFGSNKAPRQSHGTHRPSLALYSFHRATAEAVTTAPITAPAEAAPIRDMALLLPRAPGQQFKMFLGVR
jgi:hypothetical protein